MTQPDGLAQPGPRPEPSDGPSPSEAARGLLRVVVVDDHAMFRTGVKAEIGRSLDVVGEADVVITMGCGETCPIFPGKRYEDWPVDDPAGQERETVRAIVDDVDARVRALLDSLS